MKLLTLILLTVIVRTNCGFVEGIYNTVKETTGSITHGVEHVWSYGTDLVFGENSEHPNNTTAVAKENRSIIGGIIDTVHEKVNRVRQSVHSIFAHDKTNATDKSFIESMIDRVHGRMTKIKGFFVENTQKPLEFFNATNAHIVEKTKTVRDGIKKLIFGQNTENSQNHVVGFIERIKEKLNSIRREIVEGRNNKTDDGPIDGAGMIDIRAKFDDLDTRIVNRVDKARDHVRNGANQLFDDANNAINIGYQKVHEHIKDNVAKIDDDLRRTVDSVRSNTRDGVHKIDKEFKSFIDQEKEFLEKHQPQANNDGIVFKDE